MRPMMRRLLLDAPRLKRRDVWEFRHTGTNSIDVRFDFLAGNTATVHWGDGSAPEAMTSGVNSSHTYTDAGPHTIRVVCRDEAVTYISASVASLSGPLFALKYSPRLTYANFHTNQLTGSIPDLSGNPALQTFSVSANQLTGSIPDLSGNPALQTFYANTNQLTGSIPDLSGNPALQTFSVHTNQLTGSIPDLSGNPALLTFTAHINQLTGYEGGLQVMRTMTNFRADDCKLTVDAVNQILIDLDTARVAGNPVCTANLGGGTNAAPTGDGITAKNNLLAAEWPVTTN